MLDVTYQFEGAITRVLIGKGALDHVGRRAAEQGDLAGLIGQAAPGRRALLVSDDNVAPLYAGRALEALRSAGFNVQQHVLPAGEGSKSLDEAIRVYEALARAGVGRDGWVVALGGGVVSDLAGFVAATWLRGVRLVICPTTLESAVDACLGGKNAVNLPAAKNLVGTFHHPVLIAIEPSCLSSLSSRDFRAGLAESVKHALTASTDFLSWHEAQAAEILARNENVVSELIHRNLAIKAGIVAEDPREITGRRQVLNFGHTLGHAIERCANYELRHGECVALGMLAAVRMSLAMGLLHSNQAQQIEALLQRLELPTRLTVPLPMREVLQAVGLDKKRHGARLHWVLLEGVGRPVIRDDIDRTHIETAIASLRSS